MREVLYEESANPSNFKMQKAIYVLYSVLFWSLLVFTCFVFFVEAFISGFDFLLLFLIPPTFLFWFVRSKIYYCVDLIFVNGSTRVVKVINFKRRKKVIIFESKEVIQVGKITSDSFEKVLATPNVKRLYATPNKYITEGFYVFLTQNGQQYVVILECKETYLLHLVNFAGRQVVEKDYK